MTRPAPCMLVLDPITATSPATSGVAVRGASRPLEPRCRLEQSVVGYCPHRTRIFAAPKGDGRRQDHYGNGDR